MKSAIFAFTRRGCETARRAAQALGAEECRMFTMAKFGFPDFEGYRPPLAEFVGPLFAWADILIFIGSTGMAVRGIAPWVRDKKTDPGVIVIDEAGTWVISLLSGHIGGANAETRRLAQALGGEPVITTATDVNGKFSVDDWAARNGLQISSMSAAKAVSAAILEGDVPLMCDFPISGQLPKGVVPGTEGPLGIYIGYRKIRPFAVTLRLTPKVLQLGIGCRKGIAMDAVERAVQSVLDTAGIAPEAVASAASITLKAEEAGLLAFCEKHALPVRFYTAEQLRSVPGTFPASSFVSSVTGVDNVCQRSAMVGAERCIVEKTAMDGVTVSVAQRKWEAVF